MKQLSIPKVMTRDEAILLWNRLFPLKYTDLHYNVSEESRHSEMRVLKVLAHEHRDGFLSALTLTGQIKLEATKK